MILGVVWRDFMKQTMLLITCAALLASCDKGPQVDLKNATGNEVAKAVSQSGAVSSASFIEPGEWQLTTKIEQMEMPGLSPEDEARMKQMTATDSADTANHCVTPAEAKKPMTNFSGTQKSCTYDHYTMGAGRIDIAMVCQQSGETQTSHIVGTFTPTTLSADIESRTTAGRHAGGIMKSHIDYQRIGECTGKDDDE
jgi:hypothetical protein